MYKKIVATGIGVVSPIGIGKEQFWKSLMEGSSGAGPITHFDTSEFSVHFACEVKNFNAEDYIDKKKIRRMDRFVRFAVAAAKMAVEDSQIDFTKENPERCGVIVGSGIGGLQTIHEQSKVLYEKGPGRISPFLIPMLITNMAPGEIAIMYGLRGPNYSLSSACATSTHCIGDVLRLMRYGDMDVALVGGSEAAITPLGFGGFCSIKALSCKNDTPLKASRPFDAQRDGFVMGEGSGILVFETEEHAKARGAKIYGEIAGYGATDDAYHITAPEPNAIASAKGIELAIKDANLRPEDVEYINAHGTSTVLNDKIETLAIKKVFGEHAKKMAISSTKSMSGHLLGAAGAVELIATLLCIKNGYIHPTINYEFPDPDCDLDYVPNKPRQQQIKVAISNSLGFGGHNATILVKKYD
ncbi:MAG: beta-ketoacyl-[acyl-carrier-protein] synthase II [Elusimicrobia bacterium RIFOXYC2_FULL_34_12]|nr:MAG: beta-ketoacyl-[acyl-carrier-protein] synthase II [Elusimicrobia bacterium RIFOXYC2_FULL_34_12]OGS38049.1 MAG: beta-ketoacyl-[acyl-carrier-protein] synthase II [Elusimicrobia bacterium RIFOXYD2_FULL_34_30]HAM39311.1 beta-ketoacyl-[acyl-carrier-protein] synthase II [Elusimicrobiota bacterium]